MNEKFRSALFVGLICLVVCSKFGQLVEGVTSPFGFNSNQSKHEKNANSNEKCFCKLSGDVDDCGCKIEYIDRVNNYKIYPRLATLVQKDYFRYIKVNLKKICQFWPDDARCSLKDCHVKVCSEEDLPEHFKAYLTENYDNKLKKQKIDKKPSTDDNNKDKTANCEQANPLGQLNETLTDENLKTFEEWNKFDESQANFCEPDDEYLAKAEYTDLVANPERYTGYKAPHAHKIWNSIYRENCFQDEVKRSYGPETETCLEKRIFHRLVSGLHASINIHLSANYLHKGVLNQPDRWGPNLEEFKLRFDPATTNSQGPQWLRNLYFIYLVELRAITKAAPYFEKETFFAGRSSQDDLETKTAVLDLLNITKSFEHHFDETILFKGDPTEAKQLKEAFQMKFRNITKIMDCVGCDKCRLWGKVQTLALGTSLKILFSGFDLPGSKVNLQLSRAETVALFNGFSRLSNSIVELENFRDMLAKDENHQHTDSTTASSTPKTDL